MSNDNIFKPLPPDKIKKTVESIETDIDLIVVTLVDGAQLVGALGNRNNEVMRWIRLFRVEKGSV